MTLTASSRPHPPVRRRGRRNVRPPCGRTEWHAEAGGSATHSGRRGHRRSLSRRHPTRLQAWRELGDLPDDAFVMPDTIGGDWVTDRFFCRGLHSGSDVPGRAGLVCVRHNRWLGITTTRRPSTFRPCCRRNVTSGTARVQARPVRLARDAHRCRVRTRRRLPRHDSDRQDRPGCRWKRSSTPNRSRSAGLRRPSLLVVGVDPATEPADVRRVLDGECRRVVPERRHRRPWRASTRLQTILFALRSVAAPLPGRAWSGPDRWNLLRHLPR